MFGMTRGEIELVLAVFGFVYAASLLPKVVKALRPGRPGEGGSRG